MITLAEIHLDGFLAQAFVYLLAAVVSVPVARKLGLGSVLGYLLAGTLIGPAALGFVGGEGRDVMHFAEFGVVVMLFLIGLELKPSLLWRLRGPIFGLGGCQVVFTGLAFTAGGMAMGWPWRESLAAGYILAMSSTAIVIQSLAEKGLLKTKGGQGAFAVLLFQDLAVIPLLALLPLLASLPRLGGEAAGPLSGLPGWQQALATAGAVAVIIVAGKYLLRPAFRLIAASRLRELFTATALLLVIGISLLMQRVGLSPALGAFLAGVVLADSEFRHELESNLEPFKGLLLGVFFIAVGAGINFRLIIDQAAVIFPLTAAVVMVKAGVLRALGYAFREDRRAAALFSLSLAQVGEFAFVLFSFAENGGILPPEKTSLLVAVTALSMAMTPLMLLIYDRLLLRCPTAQAREQDTVTDDHSAVIIAGYGRFGLIVGRLLAAHGHPATVIDLDADQVELMRRLGSKVFYGDASRADLLHAAGAAHAKLFVLATDDDAKSLEIVDTVQREFPNLRILARASGRLHSYDLIKRGVTDIWRETLDSSLEMGVLAMRALGHRGFEARRAARLFRIHDEQTVRELAEVYGGDESTYIAIARQRIETIDRILREDTDKHGGVRARDSAWDTTAAAATADRAAEGRSDA